MIIYKFRQAWAAPTRSLRLIQVLTQSSPWWPPLWSAQWWSSPVPTRWRWRTSWLWSHPPHTIKQSRPPQTIRQSHPPQTFRQSHPPHTIRQSHPPETIRQSRPPQTRLINHRSPIYQTEQYCICIRHGGEEVVTNIIIMIITILINKVIIIFLSAVTTQSLII